MKPLGTPHPVQIEYSLTNYCIVVEDLIELSKLEEKDLVKVVTLDFPVLTHGRGEVRPLFFWDQKGANVIVGVGRRATLEVLDVFFFDKPRSSILNILE